MLLKFYLFCVDLAIYVRVLCVQNKPFYMYIKQTQCEEAVSAGGEGEQSSRLSCFSSHAQLMRACGH